MTLPSRMAEVAAVASPAEAAEVVASLLAVAEEAVVAEEAAPFSHVVSKPISGAFSPTKIFETNHLQKLDLHDDLIRGIFDHIETIAYAI